MDSKNIEVEIRSFITKKKYFNLLKFFKKDGKFVSRDTQETYYFKGLQDLRIQKSDYYSKIWLKGGKIHDTSREELEIKLDKNDFEKLKKLFDILGYKVEIKWLRTRNAFIWKGINVAVDYTKGYGYIIELEKITDIKNKERFLIKLRNILNELNIKETPRSTFEKKFKHYKNNWKKLIK